MIRLTGKSGIAIYINPDKIIGFNEDVNYGGTFINCGKDQYIVTEPPEEVARKVLEWRLAMERYRAALITGKKEIALAEYQHLKQLTGLEEPNHDAG